MCDVVKNVRVPSCLCAADSLVNHTAWTAGLYVDTFTDALIFSNVMKFFWLYTV